MNANNSEPHDLPGQSQQSQPGDESKMHPEPEIIRDDYEGSKKLRNKWP